MRSPAAALLSLAHPRIPNIPINGEQLLSLPENEFSCLVFQVQSALSLFYRQGRTIFIQLLIRSTAYSFLLPSPLTSR